MINQLTRFFKSNPEKAFKRECLNHNNKMIIIIATFLFFEQLIYAFYINQPTSLISRVHVFTAMLSLVLALSALYIKKFLMHFNTQILNIHVFISIISYFGIAIYRTVYLQTNSLSFLPVIYIAVIYGFSFVAYLEPKINFILYTVAFLIIWVLYPLEYPAIKNTTILPDIFTNNLLAFLASVISYNRFEKDYQYKKKLSKKNENLIKISSTDMLTGVSNRRFIDEEIMKTHESAIEFKTCYSLIIADLDHFKRINDTYGHHVGDQVLIEFTNLIESELNEDSIIGRWGGEEFMILCNHTTIKAAEQIAENLRRTVEKNNFPIIKGLTCSFGIASYESNTIYHDIVRYADQALYTAKDKGRNTISVYKHKKSKEEK
jgi:diguanylate cyclase (GGDEF)-like protein